MEYLGRSVLKKMEFVEQGTWKAMWEAQGWLKANGYSYGSSDRSPNPQGFIYHREWPFTQKWHNMSAAEKRACDGVIIGDLREGPVSLLFFNILHEAKELQSNE